MMFRSPSITILHEKSSVCWCIGFIKQSPAAFASERRACAMIEPDSCIAQCLFRCAHHSNNALRLLLQLFYNQTSRWSPLVVSLTTTVDDRVRCCFVNRQMIVAELPGVASDLSPMLFRSITSVISCVCLFVLPFPPPPQSFLELPVRPSMLLRCP